jgi:hypothetical protein
MPLRSLLRTPAVAAEDGLHLLHDEPLSHIPISGQEFLCLRKPLDTKDKSPLGFVATEYGALGIDDAFGLREFNNPSLWPLWMQLLSLPPVHGQLGYTPYHELEPLSDWIRQTSLLNMAVALVGLTPHVGGQTEQAREALKELASALEERAFDPSLARHWQVQAFLEGFLGSGLTLERYDSDWILCLREGWDIKPDGTLSRYESHMYVDAVRFRLTPQGIGQVAAHLLNPWLEAAHATAATNEEGLTIYRNPPGSLVSLLWLQVADAAVGRFPLRLCGFEGCPGPPHRPQVFLWSWGKSVKDTRHSDSAFCSWHCSHARTEKWRRRKKDLRVSGQRCAYPECRRLLRRAGTGPYCDKHEPRRWEEQ